MADLKISQLTGATTPLAGTEVLPLVQSGATRKVATDDLTVKNVRATATTGILQVSGPTAGTTRVMTTPDANFTVARTDATQTFAAQQLFTGTTAATPAISPASDTNTGIFFPAAEEVAFASNGVETFRQASNGNIGFGVQVPVEKASATSLAVQSGTVRGNYRSRVLYSDYIASAGTRNICKIESNTAAYAITGPSVKITVFYTYFTGFANANYAEYLIQPVYNANPLVTTLTTNGGPPTITVTQSGVEATIAVAHAGDVHFYVMAEIFGNPIVWYI
jgi:hypothetical protein